MNDAQKEVMSIIATFVAGFGSAYFPNPSTDHWLSWVVAGAVAAATYVMGYAQKNPRLQPTTATELLASVKASEMSQTAKSKAAVPLAAEAAKPTPPPKE